MRASMSVDKQEENEKKRVWVGIGGRSGGGRVVDVCCGGWGGYGWVQEIGGTRTEGEGNARCMKLHVTAVVAEFECDFDHSRHGTTRSSSSSSTAQHAACVLRLLAPLLRHDLRIRSITYRMKGL